MNTPSRCITPTERAMDGTWYDDHTCRPTRRARARRLRQTLADHLSLVSTISHHFFVSTTPHHHATPCKPIATHHLAGRALPCDDARRPREGRARLHSQSHLVAQSRGTPFTFAHICTRDAVVRACVSPRRPRPHHNGTSHHTTPHKPSHNLTLESQHTSTRTPLGKHNVIPPGIERHHLTPREPITTPHLASARKCVHHTASCLHHTAM